MTLPYIFSYTASARGTSDGDFGLQRVRFYSWTGVPIGVTAVTNGPGLAMYVLLFGEDVSSVTPAVPDTGWTSEATGTVGDSTFILLRRETGVSEPEIYDFNFTPTNAPFVLLGFTVADADTELVGAAQFDIGDTATSGSLTVPAGNVLSVHLWGGAQYVSGGAVWEPDPATFPLGRKMLYSFSPRLYAGSIGEIRDAASAAAETASVSDGGDNFGIQFLFSDTVPGGWGVGYVRMGAN